MWGGSNYPSTGGNPYQQGAYGAAGYPGSSGPPPPPGQQGYSAYNVNQYPQYGGGYGGQQAYGYGGQPQYPQGQYPGYPGGGYQQPPGAGSYANYGQGYGGGYSQGGAVPGFTAPPQYGGGQAPPPMQPPSSHHYNNGMARMNQMNYYQQLQQMGMLDEEDQEFIQEQKKKERRRRRNQDQEEDAEDAAEDMRKMHEKMQKMEEKFKEMTSAASGDADQEAQLKETMRARFVGELIRRQTVNGTFEPTDGVIVPFEEYDEHDPVTIWFATEKDDPIAGEKWSAEWDVQFLRNGIRGWGTDEQAIIDVVSTRCNSQRNQLLLDYKTAYGRDLIRDLHGDLSGDFRECVLALFETPARYDAYSIKKAIYGAGTNEKCLIEILMTRTNAQIKEMVEEYNNITYSKRNRGAQSLEEDIEGDTSGPFKHLLIASAQGNRNIIESDVLSDSVEETMMNDKWTGMFHVNYDKLLNMDRIRKRATELANAGIEQWGTDEETFIRVFSTQDYYTLRAIWEEYIKITQVDLENTAEGETSGDFKRGLKAITKNVRCRPMYFAERLYKAMKGAGTDDTTLIRVIVSRSEIDMVQIKQCFLDRYHQTLWKFIMDDTSGDYKKLLCGIVGKN